MTTKGGRKLRHRRTKKHYRRKTKHHRRKHKKRKTRRHRGGGLPGISPRGGSPAAPFSGRWGGKMEAFPPGPMYKPSQLGKVDALYYGKLEKPFLPDPTNTYGNGVTRTHGKIKGGRRKKSRKGGRKSRKGGRGRRKRGGSLSQLLSNNIPGFSDVRDVYWKGGEVFKDGYNTWFGYNEATNTSAGVQPIGKNKDVVRPEMVDIPTNLKSGALEAKKYNVA